MRRVQNGFRTMRLSGKESMPSVLVVDDDQDSRQAVSLYLSKAGFAVRSAPNGREALYHLLTAVPDVIVLDLVMPEMSGVEFLHILRSYIRWTTLPVLVLTGHPDAAQEEELKELGVRRFFLKASYSLDDLARCVRLLADDPHGQCAC